MLLVPSLGKAIVNLAINDFKTTRFYQYVLQVNWEA